MVEVLLRILKCLLEGMEGYLGEYHQEERIENVDAANHRSVAVPCRARC